MPRRGRHVIHRLGWGTKINKECPRMKWDQDGPLQGVWDSPRLGDQMTGLKLLISREKN